MTPGITILVCTFNGARRLPGTLEHIAAQKIPASFPCEVILVDNASVDDTVQLAQQEWKKYNTNLELKIVMEPRPGLTYARERGFEEARYEYIILCDDDNWLSPSYVYTAFMLMEQYPAIGILGGYGQFAWETTPPDWLTAFNLYAGGPQAATSGKVTHHLVYGAGAVLRKSAWATLWQHGFESALTDRLGYQLSSGGDHELCYALALAGYEVWYDERLRFQHFITNNRLTKEYYLTYIAESSACFSVLEPYKILLKTGKPSLTIFRWELFKSFGYHLKKTALLLFRMAFAKKSPGQRMAYRLELSLLKGRLQSYRHLATMERNYAKAIQFKQRLPQEVLHPRPAIGLMDDI